RPEIYLLYSANRPDPDAPSFPTRRSSDLTDAVGTFEPAQVTAVARASTREKERHRAGGRLRDCKAPAENRDNRDNRGYLRTLVQDRKSTRLNSSHVKISYAVFCLKKKKST